MSEGWAQNLANELHQPIERQFPKRRVISYGIDNIWAADLVEMGKFSKWNKGIKYLLMVIDVFSKFGWIRPLKDKRGQTVADAFRSIFAERAKRAPARKPKMLWTDKGSELFNGIMKDLLHKNGVKLYTTENEEKSSVVERWNRTMKEKLFRMFSANNNTIYFDKLDELVDQYNHRFHSSIQMTPAEASKQKNESAQGNTLARNTTFVTQYDSRVPNLKQILMNKWHLIESQPLLRQIYKEPPLISYKGVNL